MAPATLVSRYLLLAALGLSSLGCGGGGGEGASDDTRIPHPDGDAGAAFFAKDGSPTSEGEAPTIPGAEAEAGADDAAVTALKVAFANRGPE